MATRTRLGTNMLNQNAASLSIYSDLYRIDIHSDSNSNSTDPKLVPKAKGRMSCFLWKHKALFIVNRATRIRLISIIWQRFKCSWFLPGGHLPRAGKYSRITVAFLQITLRYYAVHLTVCTPEQGERIDSIHDAKYNSKTRPYHKRNHYAFEDLSL